MLVAPVVAPLTVCGLATALASPIFPWLAEAALVPSAMATWWIERVATTLAKWPGSGIGLLASFAFCLVLPLTAAGAGTVIVGIGFLLLTLALSISGGFANLARLRVARLDGREPRPGAYLSPVPGASARRRLFRRLRDPQRWMDLLWVIVYFPVSLFTWIISVGWLALAVGGLLSPIIDVILELILNATVGDQSQSLAEFLGLYPPLLWEIGIHLSAGVVFSLTAPFVLRGLAAMQAGLIHGMLSWRSEVSRLEQMARY